MSKEKITLMELQELKYEAEIKLIKLINQEINQLQLETGLRIEAMNIDLLNISTVDMPRSSVSDVNLTFRLNDEKINNKPKV